MATTAVDQLQEQIEAVRREAYAAGYAAAMQSVREFIGKQLPEATTQPSAARPRQGERRAPRQRRANGVARVSPRARRATATRPPRGTNARLVEQVLQSNAPRALRPAEIRTTIQRERGVAIAFTSIRHALGQLESRRLAEQIEDSNTWRYCAGGEAAGDGKDAAVRGNTDARAD